MGTYYGVNKVQELGNQIQVSEYKSHNVISNNRLVMILCNGLYAIAPDVTDNNEYKQFYDSYSMGNWLSIKLYEVTEENIKLCPDKGRQPCTYR